MTRTAGRASRVNRQDRRSGGSCQLCRPRRSRARDRGFASRDEIGRGGCSREQRELRAHRPDRAESSGAAAVSGGLPIVVLARGTSRRAFDARNVKPRFQTSSSPWDRGTVPPGAAEDAQLLQGGFAAREPRARQGIETVPARSLKRLGYRRPAPCFSGSNGSSSYSSGSSSNSSPSSPSAACSSYSYSSGSYSGPS